MQDVFFMNKIVKTFDSIEIIGEWFYEKKIIVESSMIPYIYTWLVVLALH